MKKMKIGVWITILAAVCASIVPMTAYAGWVREGDSYRYKDESGAYAVSCWVEDGGKSYYMNQNGIMAVNTTTPDGYLVAADGSWVTETQVNGYYVRTPYDKLPYRFDSDWQRYIFDEDTDYAEVSDNRVLAAVRGIVQVSELSETDKVVYDELCKFLVGFDYGSSDYEKATKIYDEITARATYNWGDYTQADDEVYTILVNGTGKCVGFARTFKLFANAVGLKSGIRKNSAHMWNSVYIDGVAKSIDTSSTRTAARYYLDVTELQCPVCGYRNVFGVGELAHPCTNCGTQLDNPKQS